MSRFVILISNLILALNAFAGPPAIRHNSNLNTYVVAVVDRSPAALPHLAESLSGRYGARVKSVYGGVVGGFLMELPPDQVDLLAKDPRVRFVEQNHPIQLSAAKPAYVELDSVAGPEYLWHLDRVDARQPSEMDGQYFYCDSGKGVPVYVIDTGIRASHGEFAGLTIEHHSVTDDNYYGVANPCDHGTAVASLIAGIKVGVAPDVSLIDLQTYNSAGYPTTVQIDPSVITVGGTSLAGGQDKRWQEPGLSGRDSGSNSGPCISIWAPAANVWAARSWSDTAYGQASGTSFAAPIVTGMAARYIQGYRGGNYGASPTPWQVYQYLTDWSTNYRTDGAPLVAETTAPDGSKPNLARTSAGTRVPVGMVYRFGAETCRSRLVSR